MNPRLCNSLLQLPTYLHKDSLKNYIFEEMAKRERSGIKRDNNKYDVSLEGTNKTLWMARFLESPAMSSPPNISSPLSPISTIVRITNSDSNGQAATILQEEGLVTGSCKRKSSQRWSRQSGGWSISKGFAHNSEYLKKLRLQRGSLTYRGAMLNIPRYKIRTTSCPDIYRNSITTISESTKVINFPIST